MDVPSLDIENNQEWTFRRGEMLDGRLNDIHVRYEEGSLNLQCSQRMRGFENSLSI